MRDDKEPTDAGAPRLHDPAGLAAPPPAPTAPASPAAPASPPAPMWEAAPPGSPTPRRQRRWLRRLSGYAVALAVMGGLAYLVVVQMPARQGASSPGGGRSSFGGRSGQQGPVPVLVATARSADVPVYYDGVGTARALNIVTVRPQVDGKLIRLNFREGEDVERGAVLAEIDPTIYQAQLDQAVAKKAQDEAQLANAKIDLDRYTRLAQTNAATKQQADTQKALVAQLAAVVQADQASIDNARAYLDYTKITAPISGRTGIRLVDAGNLVRASETTGIVVITQVRPISVIFTLPQQQLPAVNKAFGQGPLTALALASDNRTVADRGTLQVIDNQVDQTTGTVKLRAQFPNKDLALWPGQFVDVKLLVDTLRNVVVVPTAAVQRGPNGTFAYVVKDAAGGGDKAPAANGDGNSNGNSGVRRDLSSPPPLRGRSDGEAVREGGNSSGSESETHPPPQPSPTRGEGGDAAARGETGQTARAERGQTGSRGERGQAGAARAEGDRATVSMRPVTVTQQDDVQAVIASGLQSGEQVVTSGFAQLTDDSRVIISREERFSPGADGPAPASPPAGAASPRAAGSPAPPSPTPPPTTGAASEGSTAREAAPDERGLPPRDPRARRSSGGEPGGRPRR